MGKTLLRGAILILLPLVTLEAFVRTGVLTVSPPYPAFDEALQLARDRGIDFIFAGSSRVAAAVRTDTFSRAVSPGRRTPVTTVNLGRGYSTLAEDYVALRRLYEAGGNRASGATVLIEAPHGLPVFSTFEDSWVHPDMPELLVPLLTQRELAGLWRSRTPLDSKVEVTTRYSLKSVEYVAQLRAWTLSAGQRVLHRVATRAGRGGSDPDDTRAVDLEAVGGISTDRGSVERARRLALLDATMNDVTEAIHSERPIEDWSQTILLHIRQLVNDHGGRLVVFDVPLSSVLARVYETPVRRADAARFLQTASRSGVTFVNTRFQATDDDFPDYWHLRASRADAFTESLARAYLAAPANRVVRRVDEAATVLMRRP